MHDPVVILGLGYTMQRLASRLLPRGVPVYAAVRRPERFFELRGLGLRLCDLDANALPAGAVLVHSVPPLAEPEKSELRAFIRLAAPRRLVYISSTGVYGALQHVDASSPAVPSDEKGRERLEEEQWLAGGPWPTLILRSAAIYGPGRGIHVRLREGKRPRGAGGMVSRIHVEDLARLVESAIESSIAGAWPVADDLPAASDELAAWCAALMGIRLPGNDAPEFPVAGRSVDGSRIRELLSVQLTYPTFETGIPASIQEELGRA